MLFRSGNLGSAINDYEKAIQLDPKFTWPYNNLAIILYSTEDPKYLNPQKAVDLLLKALEISGPRVPAYNESLAGAYARLDQFDKAIEYQNIAIDIVEERGWYEKAEEYKAQLESYKNNKILDQS